MANFKPMQKYSKTIQKKKSLIFLELHVKAYLCTMLFSRAPGEAAVQLSTDQGFVSIYIFLAQICKCYQMP